MSDSTESISQKVFTCFHIALLFSRCKNLKTSLPKPGSNRTRLTSLEETLLVSTFVFFLLTRENDPVS